MIKISLKQIVDNFKELINSRIYTFCLIFTAFLSYGYMIFHGSIGVDDTSMNRYFIEGLAPCIGRNTIFLINKIFRVIYFAPVIVDFLGVIFMIIAATLLCCIFKICNKDKMDMWVYAAFSSAMISFSLIAEVYIYYLHNGIGIGYVLTVLSFIILYTDKGNKILHIILSGIVLMFAITCYESLAVLFLFIYFMAQWFVLQNNKEKKSKWTNDLFKYIVQFLYMIPTLAIAILGRDILSRVINRVIKCGYAPRQVSSSFWIFEGEILQQIKGILKSIFVNYGVNSVAVKSLFFFNILLIFFVILNIVLIFRTKKISFICNTIGVLYVPWLLVLIEGKATPYREMQTMNVAEGFMLFTLCHVLCSGKWKKIIQKVAIMGAIVIVYNQSFESNYFYYGDYLKYESEKKIVDALMLEVEKNYDTSKPICVITSPYRNILNVIKRFYYVPKYSSEFSRMKKIASVAGIELNCGENGYRIMETLGNEILPWAVDAFSTTEEIESYFYMLGYDVESVSFEKMIEVRAAIDFEEYPIWPQNGSIQDKGEYLLIIL